MENAIQRIPTLQFLTKPMIIAARSRINEIKPRFIKAASYRNVIQTGLSVGMILPV